MGGSRTRLRHVVLCGSYLVQGILFGFTAWVLLPVFTAVGVSLEARVGIIAAGGLPWVLKAALGPVLDRFRTRIDPRAVISGAQLGIAGCVAAMASLDDVVAHTTFVAGAWLAQNVLLAALDTSTDALAIDLLAPRERGRGNALMLGAREIGGSIVAGMGLMRVVETADLAAGLWVESGLLVGLALTPFLVGPVTTPDPPAGDLQAVWTRLRGSLRARPQSVALAVAAVLLLGSQLTGSVGADLLVKRLGWTWTQIPERTTIPYLITTLAAYGGAAAVADRVGHRRLAAFGSAGMGLTWVAFAFAEPLWIHPQVVVAEVVVEAVFTAALFAGIHAYFMDLVDPSIRATQFVVFMALLNLPRVYGPPLAPPMLQAVDFMAFYALLGGLQIALAAPLWGRRPAQRANPAPDPAPHQTV